MISCSYVFCSLLEDMDVYLVPMYFVVYLKTWMISCSYDDFVVYLKTWMISCSYVFCVYLKTWMICFYVFCSLLEDMDDILFLCIL